MACLRALPRRFSTARAPFQQLFHAGALANLTLSAGRGRAAGNAVPVKQLGGVLTIVRFLSADHEVKFL